MLLDNIYIINLDKSKDRLDNITKYFNKYQLKFNRFSAVYGKELDGETLEEKSSFLCRIFLCNHGIIGCALSHIRLWEKLASDFNTDYYIIMEDDITFGDNFKPVINEIDSIKNKLDFDILSLHCGGIEINCYQYQYIYELSNNVIIGRSIYPLTTASYIISKKGAIKLLSLFKKINYHVDFEIARNIFQNNINYMTLNKNLIVTNMELDTTIGSINNKSIIMNLLTIFNLKKVKWILNLPVFTIFMKYIVTVYALILLSLLVINVLWLNNLIIYILIITELILYLLI